MLSFRIDAGTLRAPKVTAQGFLKVDGYASRVGVFEYRLPDGKIRRELREPDEVFKQDSLDSFDGATVTNDHPPVMVTPATARDVARGYVTRPARRDGDFVATEMLITDADTIAAMRAGKRELSVGYAVDTDEVPGVHPVYGPYDAVQRNIVVNHLAIVDSARAGRDARVRLDAAEQVCYNDGQTPTAPPPKDFSVTPEQLKAYTDALAAAAAEKVRADNAERERDAARTLAATERTRADNAERDLNAERTARRDDAASFDTRVAERAELVEFGRKVLGDKFRADASNREIKCACIAKIDSCDAPGAGEVEAYVDGLFTGAKRRYAVDAKQTADGAAALGGARPDRADGAPGSGSPDPEETARAAMIERNRKMADPARA